MLHSNKTHKERIAYWKGLSREYSKKVDLHIGPEKKKTCGTSLCIS